MPITWFNNKEQKYLQRKKCGWTIKRHDCVVSFQMLRNRVLPSDLYMRLRGASGCVVFVDTQSWPKYLIQFIRWLHFRNHAFYWNLKAEKSGTGFTKRQMVYARITQKECGGLWIACAFSNRDTCTMWGDISLDLSSSTTEKSANFFQVMIIDSQW